MNIRYGFFILGIAFATSSFAQINNDPNTTKASHVILNKTYGSGDTQLIISQIENHIYKLIGPHYIFNIHESTIVDYHGQADYPDDDFKVNVYILKGDNDGARSNSDIRGDRGLLHLGKKPIFSFSGDYILKANKGKDTDPSDYSDIDKDALLEAVEAHAHDAPSHAFYRLGTGEKLFEEGGEITSAVTSRDKNGHWLLFTVNATHIRDDQKTSKTAPNFIVDFTTFNAHGKVSKRYAFHLPEAMDHACDQQCDLALTLDSATDKEKTFTYADPSTKASYLSLNLNDTPLINFNISTVLASQGNSSYVFEEVKDNLLTRAKPRPVLPTVSTVTKK